ncbi:MAG TPA: hypothetical protein VG986_23645 [Pseudolabrys sp.]|nr:hypothetical protein [Pseudolabrys sp.]
MPERIRPFLAPDSAFDSDALAAMGEAFDRVKEKLDGRTTRQIELYQVARLIIAHAREGERDPDRLCNSVCATLGIQPETPMSANHSS